MDSREPCFEGENDEVFEDNYVLSRDSTSGRTDTISTNPNMINNIH